MSLKKPPVLYREMSFDRATVDETNRVVTLSFSSEAPVIRQSWFSGQWVEILRHETQAIDMTRLKDLGVLLYMHSSMMPIGGILEPYIDEGQRKCMAKARFDTDPQSDGIYQKVLSGTLRGVSVGYRVLENDWEVVKEGKMSSCGRFAGPCEIANRWTPYEVSIVPLPADATVGVGRSAGTDLEMSEYMFSRLADEVTERIVKNIPLEIHKAPDPEPSGTSQRNESSGKLLVMQRKLDLISRFGTH